MTPAAVLTQREDTSGRRRLLSSPWAALGAVLVTGAAVFATTYAVADHSSVSTSQHRTQVGTPLSAEDSPGGSVYDSQVPAAARALPAPENEPGGSVYDSQVPAAARHK